MRDRSSPVAPIAVVLGVFGLCCGLPTLLSLGVLGAVAGLSLQSWALVGLGLAVAAFGLARWLNARRKADPSCGVGGPTAPKRDDADRPPDPSTNGTVS